MRSRPLCQSLTPKKKEKKRGWPKTNKIPNRPSPSRSQYLKKKGPIWPKSECPKTESISPFFFILAASRQRRPPHFPSHLNSTPTWRNLAAHQHNRRPQSAGDPAAVQVAGKGNIFSLFVRRICGLERERDIKRGAERERTEDHCFKVVVFFFLKKKKVYSVVLFSSETR